jgi:hypothetical protein
MSRRSSGMRAVCQRMVAEPFAALGGQSRVRNGKAARNRPLDVGALGAPDGLEALECLALVFKTEE